MISKESPRITAEDIQKSSEQFVSCWEPCRPGTDEFNAYVTKRSVQLQEMSPEDRAKEIAITRAQEEFRIKRQDVFTNTVATIKQFITAKKEGVPIDHSLGTKTLEFYEATYNTLSQAISAGVTSAKTSGKQPLIVIGERHGYSPQQTDDSGNVIGDYRDDRCLVAELMALQIAKDNGINHCISETTEKQDYANMGFLPGQKIPVAGQWHLPIQAFQFADTALQMQVHDGCDPMHGKFVSPSGEVRCDAMDKGVASCMERLGNEGCIMLVGVFHIQHLQQNLKDKYAVVPINASFLSKEHLTNYEIALPQNTINLDDTLQQKQTITLAQPVIDSERKNKDKTWVDRISDMGSTPSLLGKK